MAPLELIIDVVFEALDQLRHQAGAGLVYDSEPETEYEETLNKARAALRAVRLARGEDD